MLKIYSNMSEITDPEGIVISTTGSPTTFNCMKWRLVDLTDEADGLIRQFSLFSTIQFLIPLLEWTG